MYCSSNASLAKYLQKLQANVAENYVKLHNFLTILYQGSRDQSGQAIKLFQLGWSKIVLPSLPFLTQVFHPWWCETRDSYPTTVLNERMWHFRGGVSEHTLTPPTYFHGVKTPNPSMRHQHSTGVWPVRSSSCYMYSVYQFVFFFYLGIVYCILTHAWAINTSELSVLN